jgi:hypothetical protein
MNVDKLVKLLENKGFQDPRTGNLFFGAYIYLYPPNEEYVMQKHIKTLTSRLKRPNNFLDCLTIDLFDFFVEYLKKNSFGGTSFFDQAIRQEQENPKKSFEYLLYEIENDDFFNAFEERVKEYFKGDNDKRVYLLIHGIGQIYPYLRASTFLKRIEALIKDFKIIVFYPGNYNDNEYSLFKELKTDNIYRVTLLNNLIGA